MNIELGGKYRDKVTGLVGTAIGKSTWLTGCETVGLQPPMDKDGKVPDVQWVDHIRLEATEGAAVTVDTSKEVGGPQTTPQRMTKGN